MNPEQIEQLIDLVQKSWAKLYLITLRQVYISEIQTVIVIVALLLVIFLLSRLMKKLIRYVASLKEYNRSYDYEAPKFYGLSPDEDDASMLMFALIFLCTILVICVFVFALIAITDLPTLIANPDWLVLKRIIVELKSLK